MFCMHVCVKPSLVKLVINLNCGYCVLIYFHFCSIFSYLLAMFWYFVILLQLN